MAYKDWLNEQAAQKDSAKYAGMGMAADLKPESIPPPKPNPLGVPLKYDMSKAPGGGKTEGADTYEAWYASQKEYYDKLYADTLKQISANREKAIIDASAAKGQAMPTYGANAERLASMGLTGGGYSDYLTGQAHAAYRGDVQAANALAEQSKLTAQQGYTESIMGLDQKRMQEQASAKANSLAIDKNIASGAYDSLGMLKEEAELAGLSADEVSRLAQKQEKIWADAIRESLTYSTKSDNEDGTETETLSALTDDQIDEYVAADMISKATADTLKKVRNERLIQHIRDNAMDSGDVKTFQSNLLAYWDVLGDEVAKEVNYEYNAKIALDGLTYKSLSKELNGLSSEVSKGFLDEQDALALSAYKVSDLAEKVYIPQGDMEVYLAKQGQKYTKIQGNGIVLDAYASPTSDLMSRALTEYAGSKPGTIVKFKYKNAVPYVYDGEKWVALYNSKGIGEGDWTEKSYSLPKKGDTGYSDYLTTKQGG